MAYLSPFNPAANFQPHTFAFDDRVFNNKGLDGYRNDLTRPFYQHLAMMDEMGKKIESAFHENFGKVNIPIQDESRPNQQDEGKRKWLSPSSWFKHSDPFSVMTKRPMTGAGSISIDVSESEKQYEITAAVPGFDRDNVKIEVDEDRYGQQYLTLRAEKTNQINQQDNNQKFVYKESSFASASRSIPLPTDVETEKIQAQMEHGQLHITIPKSTSNKPQGRTIAIQ